jgi:hypothetical protein
MSNCTMNLSTADLRNYRTEFHETWWSYRYMFLVDPKVFRFVVKGVKAIFLDDIGQCWNFTPHFYAVFWQPFWKWKTSWKFWKCRIAPLMVTYHYVKIYVSIIIQLEVININVWNFKFKFSRCLPFSKWLPKHGIKMGGKNSTLSDIIKIWYVGR